MFPRSRRARRPKSPLIMDMAVVSVPQGTDIAMLEKEVRRFSCVKDFYTKAGEQGGTITVHIVFREFHGQPDKLPVLRLIESWE